jgi:hypothetical protein
VIANLPEDRIETPEIYWRMLITKRLHLNFNTIRFRRKRSDPSRPCGIDGSEIGVVPKTGLFPHVIEKQTAAVTK